MEITNQADFEKIFREICNEVIEDVTLEAFKELKNIIQDKVYDVYTPKLYERLGDNGGLKGAWGNDIIVKKNGSTGIIEYEPDLMIYNPDKAQHGNYKWGDLRENIAEYIEKGYSRGVGARPFWDFFVEQVGTELLDIWIKQAFARHGLSTGRE